MGQHNCISALPVWILALALSITGCDKGLTPDPTDNPAEVYTLDIACSDSISIALITQTILVDSLHLPLPNVITNCPEGELSFSNNLPTQVTEGTYQVNYTVTNGCSGTAICSFTLTLTLETYRKKYLGNYFGIERYTANYGQILISETTKEVEVTLGPDDNDLIVDGDEVIIDTTGVYPYPSCCEYRWYGLKFWLDSASYYKVYGGIGSSSMRSFKGKRQ